MKQSINTATLRPSLAAIALQVLRLIVAHLVATYRATAKKRPLLKLYRLELRALYAVGEWIDRHPVLTGIVCYSLVAVLSLQMFAAFMDAWCGL